MTHSEIAQVGSDVQKVWAKVRASALTTGARQRPPDGLANFQGTGRVRRMPRRHPAGDASGFAAPPDCPLAREGILLPLDELVIANMLWE